LPEMPGGTHRRRNIFHPLNPDEDDLRTTIGKKG